MKSEWKTLGLSKAVLETIDSLNFQKMTPVQVGIKFPNENLKQRIEFKLYFSFSLQQFPFFWIGKMLP